VARAHGLRDGDSGVPCVLSGFYLTVQVVDASGALIGTALAKKL
jgi:hypothetical protein